MPQDIFWLALAGALGTLARFGLSEIVSQVVSRGFPWSTLIVNTLGSLLFGLVWTLAAERELISSRAGLVLLTGFMGSFTTFSTYAFETSQLFAGGDRHLALLNVAAQTGIGLCAVFLGSRLAHVV